MVYKKKDPFHDLIINSGSYFKFHDNNKIQYKHILMTIKLKMGNL